MGDQQGETTPPVIDGQDANAESLAKQVAELLAESEIFASARSVREPLSSDVGRAVFVTLLAVSPTTTLADSTFNASTLASLQSFIVNVIQSIQWYQRKIRQANAFRCLWAIVFVGIAVGLPLFVARIPGSASAGAISRITASLTGLIVLQRVLTTFFQAHTRYALWWKTSADLKELCFSLRTSWSHKDLKDTDVPAAIADIDSKTAAARKLVDDEQTDFFDKLALPNIDILDIVSKTRTEVASLITGLVPGTAGAQAAAGELLKARQAVSKAQAQLDGLNTVLAQTNADLANAANDGERKTLSDRITSLIGQRDRAVTDLIAAKAALVGLAAS